MNVPETKASRRGIGPNGAVMASGRSPFASVRPASAESWKARRSSAAAAPRWR